MINMKLFTQEEWIRTLGMPNGDPQERPAETEWFRSFLQCFLEEEVETPPFRDEESVALLKGEGMTFVSDDDWYSVYGEGGSGKERDCITNIPKWMKFALVAIYYSRQGRYTWINESCVPYEQAWNHLSGLPFDILVAVKVQDIESVMSIFLHLSQWFPCRIVNYPYKKQSIEVTLKEFIKFDDDFYTRISEHRWYDTSNGLCMGKDGKYYSDLISVKYGFQYYWGNDVEGLIRYMEEKYPDRIRLGEVHEIYNTFTLAKALGLEEGSVIGLMYWDCKRCREAALKAGKISDQEYGEISADERQGEEYKDYVYFRDTFQFISHLTAAPDPVSSRKLPVLMVDKNYDGTYMIHGTLTVKYPEFEECISDVVEGRSPDRERILLVVDVEEQLRSAGDVDEAVYGFRLLQDSLEIFDRYEAVQLFGQALKEAYTSGACTIK